MRLYAAADWPFLENLSTSPVVYLIHNALTKAECDSLIETGKNKVFGLIERRNIL